MEKYLSCKEIPQKYFQTLTYIFKRKFLNAFQGFARQTNNT